MAGRFFPGVLGPILSLVVFLTPFTTTSAQQAEPQQDGRERGVMIQSFLNERLTLWQQRLTLADWKISIIMSYPSDLKPKTLGNIHWDADKHVATIRVLDASEYKLPFQEMLDDMEFTVVHELIHLELSSLPRSDASRRDEEHAVNQIADALLKLDHKK